MFDWYFGDSEPLAIIVSLLYPEEIYENEDNYNELLSDYNNKTIRKIHCKIKECPEVNKVYNLAVKAIKNKKIKLYESENNSKISPLVQVNIISFFDWVNEQDYAYNTQLHDALKNHVLNKRIQEYGQYPIDLKELKFLIKEPLWNLDTGILYITGNQSLGTDEDDFQCVIHNPKLKKIKQYAKESHEIRKLHLKLKSIELESGLSLDNTYKVQPKDLLQWARNLHLEFPILDKLIPDKKKELESILYATPEMILMNDAAQKFWKHYNLKSPDISKSYAKAEITTWIKSEAKKRGYEVSDNIANAMDTIIRCPHTRKGGRTY